MITNINKWNFYYTAKCPPRNAREECPRPQPPSSSPCFYSPTKDDKRVASGDDEEFGRITISKPGGIHLFSKKKEGELYVSISINYLLQNTRPKLPLNPS